MAVWHWFLAYYSICFCFEEEFFAALRTGGLRNVWYKSGLFSVGAIAGYFVHYSEAGAAAEMRRHCMSTSNCRAYLRRRENEPPWSWLGRILPTVGEDEVAFIDSADLQWRDFRSALPLLALAAVSLALLVRFVVWIFRARKFESVGMLGSSVRAAVGLAFLLYVHGAGAVFVLMLIFSFYATSQFLAGSRFAVPAVWFLALAAIAAKESEWPLRDCLRFQRLFGSSWAFLDGRAYQGEYDWSHSVNLLVLKLLSYALDLHRAASLRGVAGGKKVACSEVASVDDSARALLRYGPVQCLAHALYAPLFLAGPTICFDDFVDQCETLKPSRTNLGWYLAQLVVMIAYLELFTSLAPCFAIARSGEFRNLGPRLGAYHIFLTLHMMWLKFGIIWRVARAWALADGVDPPENMRRCLSNHYSIVGFWKCWHVSFNRWLVQYIYKPLGGRDSRVMATAVVFLFVSIWHDAQMNLLAWGCLNTLFIAGEIYITRIATKMVEAWGLSARHPRLYRYLCAFAGATNIFLLCVVNMIGYSVGVSGMSSSFAIAASERAELLRVVGFGYLAFASGTHVMLEARQFEGTVPATASPPATCEHIAAPVSASDGKED
eukprot:TRINITY_DN76785_c0_g1_i1.p1 TRINITY_DN76785_c0_g1~~TRINITY_DN76785_c0_g1_i1.p1  ORF type:complete len:622 (-),score=47.26 TRINITY_DN76785_c0_g1_i1:26-1840(-)